MVSPEESASNPDWWKDDRYAIYDLSVNSATAYPAHEERVSLIDAAESYRAQGYAYSGGGRRVTRVELSLDQGRTWRLANIHYAEDTYRDADPRSLFGGKVDVSWRETCFCWCFWSLDIPLPELASASDLLVRAMDEAMNVQPRDMYWSVLGMMNNPWFRIVITNDPSTSSLRFEHPTQPALMPGGWMERVKAGGGDLANGFWGEHTGSVKPTETIIVEDVVMTNPTALTREVTLADFRLHEEAAHPWFVMQGQVYDGTSFLKEHPGGAQSIISAAAQDSTDEFMAIHSETAKAMMPRHHIGYLSAESLALLAEPSLEATSDYTLENNPVFLHPRHWFSCTLISRQIISHDTRLFTYSLSHPAQRLGLPVGQHLMVRLRSPITQETIIRSYTPLSCPSRKGEMQLLVKIYFDSPDGTTVGGKMSQALEALEVGKQLECKGPIGKFEYIGKGLCRISGTERKVRKFGMICAGTGVTPIFQVLRAVVEEREGGVKVTVLSGNRGIEDILCKKEMDAYEREVREREKDSKAGEKRVRIVYTLTKPPREWMGRKGRITGDMVEDEGLKPDGQTMILICGPPALEKSLETSLKEKGWKDEDLLFF